MNINDNTIENNPDVKKNSNGQSLRKRIPSGKLYITNCVHFSHYRKIQASHLRCLSFFSPKYVLCSFLLFLKALPEIPFNLVSLDVNIAFLIGFKSI